MPPGWPARPFAARAARNCYATSYAPTKFAEVLSILPGWKLSGSLSHFNATNSRIAHSQDYTDYTAKLQVQLRTMSFPPDFWEENSGVTPGEGKRFPSSTLAGSGRDLMKARRFGEHRHGQLISCLFSLTKRPNGLSSYISGARPTPQGRRLMET
eukprot:CAMPEP_0113721380 /NCGR_PEP_ID=MMETSP0038_2-20120614/37099_1 /TAXON_ID=2898 /ORGANISM="Cryptomonas paramecium" /LENGTH=154 /DNA_ID=CAMNT_0000650379 /DNA_START=169 /DNA_END=630 /DNA_ORIENTATION=- /assembly_acc=CAM_ASM_000170